MRRKLASFGAPRTLRDKRARGTASLSSRHRCLAKRAEPAPSKLDHHARTSRSWFEAKSKPRAKAERLSRAEAAPSAESDAEATGPLESEAAPVSSRAEAAPPAALADATSEAALPVRVARPALHPSACDAAVAISSGAAVCPTTLDFSGTTTGSRAIIKIAAALERAGPSLRLSRLSLRGAAVGNDGAQALARALAQEGAAKLRALDLSSSGIGDAGAAALARSCCTRTGSLSSLGLALNRIATKGGAAFVDALDQPDRNRALRSLTLSSNRISLRDLRLIESLVDRNRLAANRPTDSA